MNNEENPEIGHRLRVGRIDTNYHDKGKGLPVLMIHGSGPGVTAWANWRLNIGPLSEYVRIIAPDMVGFGYTEAPQSISYDMDTWIGHLVGFMDALSLPQVDLIGNSFGGGISLALASRHPDRVRRMVLMGSVGTSFTLTPGLDAVWGYEPSLENMKGLLDVFAHDRTLVSDELAALRYRASVRPGVHERFARMFSPGPRQRYIDALATPAEGLRLLQQETLIIHGREDRVIPLQNSIDLASILPRAQLHVFPHCGHWTQIEWAATFNRLVGDFLVAS